MDWSGVRIDVGGGVRLRPWRAGDLEALLRHADDAEVSRGTSDRFPHPYTRGDGEAFLAGRVVDFSDPVFAIEVDGQWRIGTPWRRQRDRGASDTGSA